MNMKILAELAYYIRNTITIPIHEIIILKKSEKIVEKVLECFLHALGTTRETRSSQRKIKYE